MKTSVSEILLLFRVGCFERVHETDPYQYCTSIGIGHSRGTSLTNFRGIYIMQ